jgi:IclR family acetate operon transcriptional repressor
MSETITTKTPDDEGRQSYMFRMLTLLEHVALDDEESLQPSELASRLGMPSSTAARQVALLDAQGFIRRGEDGVLLPGPRMVQMALRTVTKMPGNIEIRRAAQSLGGATGESVSVGLIVGNEIVLMAREEPEHPLRIVARVGDIASPSTTALGKAILASLPHDRQLDLLRAATTPAEADRQLAELADELEQVRTYGFAVDEETYSVGQRCRAAALVDADGRAFGGISVAGPTARFMQAQAQQIVPLLLATARDLSQELLTKDKNG